MLVRSLGQQQGNALGRQGPPGKIAKWAMTECAGVRDFQALSGRSSHHVEAATDLQRRSGGQYIAATLRQGLHLGDNVDDHIPDADQPGDHGSVRSASSFSATISKSNLLVSRTVSTASSGQASMP